MKLLRVGPVGSERPAALLADGKVVDISSLLPDISPDALSPASLARLDIAIAANIHSLTEIDLVSQRIGAPLTGIGKIVCVGLNYRQHAAEAGMPVPSEPILFMKAPDTVVGPNDEVLIPLRSTKTDYEVELAIVIGTTSRYLTDADNALDYIAGYMTSNDVSEREFQLERSGQWDKGKNCETFQPFGPLLVTADEITDPQSLQVRSTVNGEVRQNSSTSDMIFSVVHLVRYISQFMVLYPGDVINTGTPQGVGSGFTPGKYLNAGDVVEIEVFGLGAQRQTFAQAEARAAVTS
jgi:2-keto-4-pentenoate hydratase/2-oxohepta-3-ene-1,7-dioic acid hydratase in catechol pathway